MATTNRTRGRARPRTKARSKSRTRSKPKAKASAARASKSKSKSKSKTKTKTKHKTKAKASAEAEFERARKRLDKRKETRDLKTHWAHFWNVCPKCGGDMFEQRSMGIRYEVCRRCHGIYIDHAEAQLVARFKDIPRWLRAALRRSKAPKTF